MAGFLVGKVKLHTHLLHVRGVPTLRLGLAIELRSAPVLEIRVGHLKIVCFCHKRQCHQGCADKDLL